jgi:hypothetical protein
MIASLLADTFTRSGGSLDLGGGIPVQGTQSYEGLRWKRGPELEEEIRLMKRGDGGGGDRGDEKSRDDVSREHDH